MIDASIYRVLAQYTIRQAFSSARGEIERAIEKELRERLAADGVVIGAVFFGNVELPPEYKQGMQALLAEEMQAEKMRFTLDLREKQVREAELVAEAAQVTRLKQAETEAQARRIEANGEADSRRKLAEAEAYRLEVTGKAASEQLAREGTVVSRNPLPIQKAFADKLSDKVQVIIAPPQAGFVAARLLGIKADPATPAAASDPANGSAAAGASDSGTSSQQR
jgi:regulator of protease activity HflC (stomatin/prohibitin superfamily)